MAEELQEAAREIHNELEELIEVHRRLGQTMVSIEEAAERAKEIDSTIVKDLGEAEQLFDRIAEGNHTEEEKETARQVVEDLKEARYGEGEEEHVIEQMESHLETAREHEEEALHGNEEVIEQFERFERAS
jgi:hypothetical protein